MTFNFYNKKREKTEVISLRKLTQQIKKKDKKDPKKKDKKKKKKEKKEEEERKKHQRPSYIPAEGKANIFLRVGRPEKQKKDSYEQDTADNNLGYSWENSTFKDLSDPGNAQDIIFPLAFRLRQSE